MDLILFFGSGISLPHGLKSVQQITELVLDGDFHRHSDTTYYKGIHPWDAHDPTPTIQQFLKKLYDQCSRFLTEQGYPAQPNYEQLFHLCRQIRRTKMQYEDNSAVRDFVQWIEGEASPLIDAMPPYLNFDLARLASEAEVFIESVVWASVSSSGPVTGIDIVSDLLTSDLVDECDIITLNHDNLVEQKLKEESISYVDGFGQPDGDVRWYEPATLHQSMGKVLLLKPHGSITWHYFRRERDGSWIDNHAIPLIEDVEHCKDATGRRLHHIGGRPQFLSGGSKELIYNSGIYADVYDAFIESLRRRRCMVMSGYGWNDLGVSLRLTRWLDRNDDHRLILLHENPDEIKFESRGIRPASFESFVNRGQIVVIKKWLCDTVIDDLRSHLTQSWA